VSLSNVHTNATGGGAPRGMDAPGGAVDPLHTVIGKASMVLWATDAQGIFTVSDGRALDRLGLAPGEVVGRSVFEVYRDVPEALEASRRALSGEEFTTFLRTGDTTFEARFSAQRDAAGDVVGVIGVAVDVTERLQAEAERQHSLSLLRAALEATAEGVLVVDRSGHIVSCNRKFVEMWDLPEAVIETRDQERAIAHVLDKLSDPEGFVARLREMYANPELQALDTVLFRDGRVYERYSQPQRLGDEIVGRVFSFRDITDRRRTEALLQQRAEQAARFQEALVELARSRSEDLDVALGSIVQVDSRSLGVERVSIWLFNADRTELECRTLQSSGGPLELVTSSLRAAELPDYFRALEQHRVIAAHDAPTDPATHEFAESYLVPLGITSMLDVPVWRDGRMVGVVCHEHVGTPREWTVEEQDFAASIADMVSLALEASERRRAEAALRDSEASYRAIFELSNDAICVHDLETGEIMDVNRAACVMHGYTAAELRALGLKGLTAAAGPEAEAAAHEYFRRAARGEPQRVEWQARHSSGRVFWQEVDLQRVTLNGTDRLLSTARDITARKDAEEVLRRSHEELERLVAERTRDLAQTNWVLEAQMAERERAEAELRQKSSELEAVFRALPDLYFRLDSDGRFLDYRAGHRGGLFTTPDLFLGKLMDEVLPPDIAVLMRDAVREVVASRELVCVDYSLPTPSGTGEFEARLLPFGEDQIITVVRDITEQKATERALKSSEEHFRRMTEHSSDVASILDTRGVSIYHSPSIERVLGYDPNDILGSSSFDRIHPDDHPKCREVLGAMFQNPGTTYTVEFRYRHKDGSWRSLEVLGRTLLPDSPEGGVIINARDVTERRAAEEALKQAKVQAENADRAKSEFLSRMSHELRTPMNSILGFAQLLERKALPPEQLRSVEHILKAGRHLLNLINEVLDIARIEANRQQFSLEPVHAETVVQEALGLIRPLAVQRGCYVQEVAELPEVYVRADRQRLTQVLLNLLSNAVKYNRPGGSVSIVWGEGGADGEASRFRIGVRDTGLGIAEADLERIFAPFERLHAERTGEEGTGLGLALSRRLVEAMGGTLTAESTPGLGSTLWAELDLDCSPVERMRRVTGAPQAGGTATAFPEAVILYVEDNLANLTLVETILAMEPKIVLIPALQGQLGHELAVEHQPDLILLDLHLPDIPGEEVLRRLQENSRTSDIPVIVISADATDASIDRLMGSGARAYLTKPLDVDEFLETVLRVLREASPV
jgi:PAS domain S-box-containing protein